MLFRGAWCAEGIWPCYRGGLDAEDGLRSKTRQPEATYYIHFILNKERILWCS